MSFILDALKKSENDRQRQSGPALFEVRVPPPRSRFPLLAVAIVSLLVVNLGVVAWLMFRKPADAAVPQAQPAAAPQPQSAAPPVAQAFPQPPANAGAQNMGGQPPAGYPPPAAQGGYYGQPQPQGAPPPGYGQQPQTAGYAQQPPPNGYGPPPNNAYQGQQQPAYPGGGYPQPQQPADPQLSNAPDVDPGANPDDYAPAREPAPGLFGLGRAVRSTESGLPTYEEAAARVSLPNLHLDLHSYAPDPTQRFVLVNMKRLYEGQSTAEGVKVESITTDAAILSFQGTKFVLNRQ